MDFPSELKKILAAEPSATTAAAGVASGAAGASSLGAFDPSLGAFEVVRDGGSVAEFENKYKVKVRGMIPVIEIDDTVEPLDDDGALRRLNCVNAVIACFQTLVARLAPWQISAAAGNPTLPPGAGAMAGFGVAPAVGGGSGGGSGGGWGDGPGGANASWYSAILRRFPGDSASPGTAAAPPVAAAAPPVTGLIPSRILPRIDEGDDDADASRGDDRADDGGLGDAEHTEALGGGGEAYDRGVEERGGGAVGGGARAEPAAGAEADAANESAGVRNENAAAGADADTGRGGGRAVRAKRARERATPAGRGMSTRRRTRA